MASSGDAQMSTNNGLKLCALGFLTGALLLGSVRPVLAQQDQQIECVKRVAPAEPPPFAGPPRPTDAAGRDTGERNNVQSEVRPSAVCAEGAVPEIKEIAPNRPGFGKGNPLLRP